MSIPLPKELDLYWEYFKGAYVVIGMMIIGCSLPKVSQLVISLKFLSIVFAAQFLAWPLAVLALIYLDQSLLQWFEPEVHKMMVILSIVPPAANTTAYASKLDLDPEKAATTVLAGTLFALIYIPAVLILTGMY